MRFFRRVGHDIGMVVFSSRVKMDHVFEPVWLGKSVSVSPTSQFGSVIINESSSFRRIKMLVIPMHIPSITDRTMIMT